MEVRSQDKQIGIPSYSSPVAERRRGDHHHHHHHPVHGDSVVFQPHQTLDHHHHHLLRHDQLQYVNQQQIHNEPRRDPDPEPETDPDRAPTSSPTSSKSNQDSPSREAPPAPTSIPAIDRAAPAAVVRYRECLKNHAASMGGHVFDGCGEFMPGGEEGSPESLKCAACDCHRNFHRKEIDGESPRRNNTIVPPPPHLQHHQLPPQYHHRHHPRLNAQGLLPSPSLPVGPLHPMMMNFGGGGTAAESSSEDLNMLRSNNNTVGKTSGSRKRFRTKFSQEQKDKMLEFAEKLGWKIQKQDEKEVQQFCSEVNVTKQVFKVWMHNHKQVVLKKKQIM